MLVFFFSFLYLHFFLQIVLLGKNKNALNFMLLILQTDSLHSSSCRLLAVEELCAASSWYKQMGWKKWTIFFCDVTTDYIYIHISVSECKPISLYPRKDVLEILGQLGESNLLLPKAIDNRTLPCCCWGRGHCVSADILCSRHSLSQLCL